IPTPRFFRAPFVVAGRMTSLDGIENDVLRPRFRDPRVHFALTCAARGCPLLRSRAYRPDSLDSELATQAAIFINDPGRNQWDPKERTFRISRIFRWNWADFGGESGIRKWLRRYYRGWLPAGDFRIQYAKYDWALNG